MVYMWLINKNIRGNGHEKFQGVGMCFICTGISCMRWGVEVEVALHQQLL